MSKTRNKFSPEVRERAVRLVFDNEGQHASRGQAVMPISAKIGCKRPGSPLCRGGDVADSVHHGMMYTIGMR